MSQIEKTNKTNKEINDIKSDREFQRQECLKYDKECQKSQQLNNSELYQEKEFVENQIKAAKQNGDNFKKEIQQLRIEL